MFPYFALDIETSGLRDDAQVLEASVIYDDGRSIDDLPSLTVTLHYETVVGDIVALLMHAKNGLLQECLISDIQPKELIPDINAFLYQHSPDTLPTIAGKNAAGFDLPRLQRHGERYGHSLRRVSHRVLDLGSLYASDKGIPSLKDICTMVNVPYANHRSLADCMTVVQLVRRKLG